LGPDSLGSAPALGVLIGRRAANHKRGPGPKKVRGLESFCDLVFPPHLRIKQSPDRTCSRHLQSRMIARGELFARNKLAAERRNRRGQSIKTSSSKEYGQCDLSLGLSSAWR
jgi:hypothetical protein